MTGMADAEGADLSDGRRTDESPNETTAVMAGWSGDDAFAGGHIARAAITAKLSDL
jgi:hypothetical protein